MARKMIQLMDSDGDSLYPNVWDTGSWTVDLYDYETKLATLGQGSYIRTNRMALLWFTARATTAYTVSSMLQIKGIPSGWTVYGGSVYFAGVSGNLGDRVIQPAADGVWFRPNWTGTIGTGVISGWLLAFL